MTDKKSLQPSGIRPSVQECLEGWWRVSDSPVGRVFPSSIEGVRGDDVRLCDPFDLYCWRLVGAALDACRVRGVPPSTLPRLIAHLQSGGKCSNFSVHEVVAIDPDDPKGFRSKARPVTELERLGVDDAWIARSAYAKFRRVLQTTIDKADAFVAPHRSGSSP